MAQPKPRYRMVLVEAGKAGKGRLEGLKTMLRSWKRLPRSVGFLFAQKKNCDVVCFFLSNAGA